MIHMNRKFSGSILLLASAFIYGLFGVFSRLIGNKFGSFSQSWVRSLIILIVIGVIFATKIFGSRWKKINKSDIKWFLIWILPASFQPVITFSAFNHLPIATTYFLIYATMILGGILSGKIFYSEKLSMIKIISLISVFFGLFLIYGSDITLAANFYVLLALISGLLVGFWNTLSKKVSANYSEFQMMSLDQGGTFIVCLIGSIVARERLPVVSDYNAWFWIFVFAISGIVTTFLLIRGFKFVEAQTGSLILPIEVVFASVFGFLFFGEILNLNTYLGGLFIVLAACLPAIKFSKTQTTVGLN